ncbi:MAG: metal ABC transporter ATP-binding protein [Lachnospiraceae bacterium]|nr:metal ABC transporter ATP-binding protein [Lachnospiraceae bacterium]
MKKLDKPCGLHCIKVHHFGVTLDHQVILQDINLHIHCGKLNVIIGKNGAGKSTLIKAILDEIPHEGKITYQYHPGDFIQKKLKIGYVPQMLNVDKNTPLSVYDFMASYMSSVPVFFRKSRQVYQSVYQALEMLQAQDCIDRQVCNLSGGQLQRVLIALALTQEPGLLLLDEPASGIDKNGMDLFYETIDHLKKTYDLAIILISHDLDYVAEYADEVILLDKSIRKRGTAEQVFGSREFREVFGMADYMGR